MNATVPIPQMLQARKRWRGLPVPFVNLIDAQGNPDFRAIDENKRLMCIRSRTCQLCGRKLKWMVFAGGPPAAKALLYFEPAMHVDCMLYAMQTCPYILGRSEKVEAEEVQKRHEGTGVVIVREASNPISVPPDWVLTLANGYVRRANALSQAMHLHPTPVWWQSEVLHPPSMTAEDWQVIRQQIVTEARKRS
jgi:hypothetical protein